MPTRYDPFLGISESTTDKVQVIDIDPSSHRGYEIRHAAMHVAGRHAEAVEAFNMMLSRLNASCDAAVRGTFLFVIARVSS